MDSDQCPCRSHRLLQLPHDFESFPSKRCRVIRHGTHTSTVQTCDYTRMSTEPSLQNTGSPSNPTPTIVNGTPSTPTPTIVNGTPLTPATTVVVVLEAPIITMDRHIVNTQYLASKPFGSLGHSPGYNVHSNPMASDPFSNGMTKFTSHFVNSIRVVGPNYSIGIGGTTPPYTPFLFVGSQIHQTNPNMGGIHVFNPGYNPLASWWNNQPREQDSTQVSSYAPTSSMSILTNIFGMTNQPIYSRFTPRGG
jgi:hypothetical protein